MFTPSLQYKETPIAHTCDDDDGGLWEVSELSLKSQTSLKLCLGDPHERTAPVDVAQGSFNMFRINRCTGELSQPTYAGRIFQNNP